MISHVHSSLCVTWILQFCQMQKLYYLHYIICSLGICVALRVPVVTYFDMYWIVFYIHGLFKSFWAMPLNCPLCASSSWRNGVWRPPMLPTLHFSMHVLSLCPNKLVSSKPWSWSRNCVAKITRSAPSRTTPSSRRMLSPTTSTLAFTHSEYADIYVGVWIMDRLSPERWQIYDSCSGHNFCVCLVGDATERPCCNAEGISLPADGLRER